MLTDKLVTTNSIGFTNAIRGQRGFSTIKTKV